MVSGSANAALRQVARVFQEGTLTGLSDRQILERFVDSQDEAAFEVLVGRHGPMVLHVCRQLLHAPDDAEDAFQAVFLVLVRKARLIRVEGSLGPWLYTVAHRVAARARANRRRIKEREISTAAEAAEAQAVDTLERLEAAVVVQEELRRLPERLRAPLVLCYLQGMTHELAAAQIGCPVGTVRSRLSRGRAQLLRRVTRRGLTLSAAGLATALESNAKAAAIPPAVRITLIKLATKFVSEATATVGGLGASASVAALLEGVLNVMKIKKLAVIATGLVALGALGLVIAGRTAAVGGSPSQGTAPASQGPGVPSVEMNFRLEEPSAHPKRGSRTVTIVYYVGDIVMPESRALTVRHDKTSQPTTGERPKVNLKPLINLITSTIAPGTWRIDGVGPPSDGVGPPKPNAIVPFFLSISLIVKCTPEGHEQVGNLLRQIREILEARDEKPVAQAPAGPPQSRLEGSEPFPPPSTTAPASPAAQPVRPAPPSRKRVQQLLEELQREIEKLPQNEEVTIET